MTEEKLRTVLTHPIDHDAPGANPYQQMGYEDRQRFEAVRMRADRAIQANKLKVAVPQENETPRDYGRRLTRSLMPSATTYAPMGSMKKLPDSIFRDIEATVLAEAVEAPLRRGELVPITIRDAVGRITTEYVGPMSKWTDQFKGPVATSPILVNGKAMRIPTVLS